MPNSLSLSSPRFSIHDTTGSVLRTIPPGLEDDYDAYLRGVRPPTVRDHVDRITVGIPSGAIMADATQPSVRWLLARRNKRAYFRRHTPSATAPELPGHVLAQRLRDTQEPIPVNLMWGFGPTEDRVARSRTYIDTSRAQRVRIRSLQTLIRGFAYLNGIDDLLRVGSLPPPAILRSKLRRFELVPGVPADEWSRVQPTEWHVDVLRRKLAASPSCWGAHIPHGILLGVGSVSIHEGGFWLQFSGENGAKVALTRRPKWAGPKKTTGPWYAICLLAWCETSRSVECVECFLEPVVAEDWPLLAESNGERRFLVCLRQWLATSPLAASLVHARKPVLSEGNATRWDVELGTPSINLCLELLGSANKAYLRSKHTARGKDSRQIVFIEGYRCRDAGKLEKMMGAVLVYVAEIFSGAADRPAP